MDVKQSIRNSVVDILVAISNKNCPDDVKNEIQVLLEKAAGLATKNVEEIKA
jgi:hypothetical protein